MPKIRRTIAQRLSGGRWRVWFVLAVLTPASVLAVLGIADPHGTWRPISALFAPEEDGSWTAVTIDGRPALPQEYSLSVSDGMIAGGRDGCNDWHYTGERTGPTGDREIFSTLVACPEDDPDRRAYWLLVNDSRLQLEGEDALLVTARGSQAVFRRCEWTWRRGTKSAPGRQRVCIPV